MCYNEPVSWITLTLGSLFTILNLYKYHNNFQIIIISLSWFFAVSMQFWEAMLYRSTKDIKKCIFYTKGAYINNLIQPFIILLLTLKTKDKFKRNFCLGLALVYFIYSLNYVKLEKDYCAINNNGIEYSWWNEINGFAYNATIIILYYLLIDKKYRLFQVSLLIISYIISMFMRRDYIGSIWCWVASFVPLVNYIYFTYFLKIKT